MLGLASRLTRLPLDTRHHENCLGPSVLLCLFFHHLAAWTQLVELSCVPLPLNPVGDLLGTPPPNLLATSFSPASDQPQEDAIRHPFTLTLSGKHVPTPGRVGPGPPDGPSLVSVMVRSPRARASECAIAPPLHDGRAAGSEKQATTRRQAGHQLAG